MNMLDWFRNKFIPNATDFTIAELIFLYNKFGKDESDMDEDEWEFIDDFKKDLGKDTEALK